MRAWNLGGSSLWYDETVSVALAQMPAAQMVAHTAGDIHPPGYYLLLHLWQLLSRPTPAATGRGSAQPLEFLYAFVSLWASVATLALLVPVGRRLVGKPATLIGLGLAAVNPFAVWYAQEVRMYAVAGLLGLLCLWATLRALETGGVRPLALYVVTAAAGIWTLYYFVFLLGGLVAAAALFAPTWRRYRRWLAAQVGVLLLIVPWLPTLWRQATEPPVPRWRPPIASWADLLHIKIESLAAPPAGQVEIMPLWVWAAATVLLTAGYLAYGRGGARGRVGLVLAVFAPTWLLIGVSLVGPPLYYVRYLYPWSVAFPLIAGGGLAALAGRRPPIRQWLFGAALGGLLAASLVALRAFWSDASYREADHRSAVAALARQWRPGDAILVNAGWVWTPLAVYWPTGTDGSRFAPGVPPPLGERLRLIDVAGGAPLPASGPSSMESVPLVRTGSVDGDGSLGWGNPQSDFFAISQGQTLAGLDALAEEFGRIWHYRMFDTVSDPSGVVRMWLEENGTLLRDETIAGRDLGRLQLYGLAEGAAVAATASPVAWVAGETAAPVLSLRALEVSAVEAGRLVYVTLVVEPTAAFAQLGSAVSSSLRLYSVAGDQVAQQDEAPAPPSSTWAAGKAVTLRLAVAAPDPLPEGGLSVELILYRQDTLEPLAVAGEGAADQERLRVK